MKMKMALVVGLAILAVSCGAEKPTRDQAAEILDSLRYTSRDGVCYGVLLFTVSGGTTYALTTVPNRLCEPVTLAAPMGVR